MSKLRCTEQGEITLGRFVLSHVIRSVTLKLFSSNMKFIYFCSSISFERLWYKNEVSFSVMEKFYKIRIQFFLLTVYLLYLKLTVSSVHINV